MVGTITTAERLALTAEGPVAVGLDDKGFGVWADRQGRWSQESTFGAEDPGGTSAAYLSGVAWTGSLLAATYSDGARFRLAIGATGGLDVVPLPMTVTVRGDHTVTIATHLDDAVLLTDDGAAGPCLADPGAAADGLSCHVSAARGVYMSEARETQQREDPVVSQTATDTFVTHRNLLFTVAYEMTGSAADAEDVLQETWMRWAEVDHDDVRDARAYLVRITTRLSLNRLRTVQRQREAYVGPWLPEPLLTSPDVAEDVELADSVSMAMLHVLETLSPIERAVFVLREVFDLPYDDIASAVDKSPAAVRQIAHRARNHVHARQPRIEVSLREREAVVDRFLEVARGGDIQTLMDVLAPDVVLVTDAGGTKRAALRPILGRDKVMRFLAGVNDPRAEAERRTVNGAPGLCVLIDGEIDTIVTFLVEDGLVTGMYVVRNPEKLHRLAEPVSLAR